MKLTHQKLKSIVKEELKFILKENNDSVQNLAVTCPECAGSGMVWEERWDGGADNYGCPYCVDVGEDKKKIKVLQRYMKILGLNPQSLRTQIEKDRQGVVSGVRKLAELYVNALKSNHNQAKAGATASAEQSFKGSFTTKEPEEDYGI